MVQRQVVATFPNAAARDAAIAAPTDGMAAYLADTGTFQVYRVGIWRPPAGTIVHSAAASIVDIATSAGGIRDVATVTQSKFFPYPTVSQLDVVGYGGFGGGAVNFFYDVYLFGTAAVVQSGSPMTAAGGTWVAAPLAHQWANAANQDVGYKIRVTFSSGPNIHTGGAGTLLVFAA